jgi:hypothetical protein
MRTRAVILAALAASVLSTGHAVSASAYSIPTPLGTGAVEGSGSSVDSNVVLTASPDLWTALDSSQQSGSSVPPDLLVAGNTQPLMLMTVSLTGVQTEGGGEYCYSGSRCKPPPPVPLPAAAWLLLAGFAGFVTLGRRRGGDEAVAAG